MRYLRSPLALIALVTIGPFALALMMHLGVFGNAPFRTLVNADRELVDPPAPLPGPPPDRHDGRPLPVDWARYRWSLIYAKMTPCETSCLDALDRVRQVHTALGRDQDRVQRVFLTGDDRTEIDADDALVVATLNPGRHVALVALLGEARLDTGRLYVVDPLGNLVMSYPADADRRHVLEDLERLLDVSKVG